MRYSWHEALLQEQVERRTANLWRMRSTLSTAQKVKIVRSGQTTVNFSSNDYLGLSNHPRLVDALAKAGHRWGVGSGASHLICGHQAPHQALEAALADYVGAESVLLFSSGYMANLALATSFTIQDGLILQDSLNHASLIDGARLSRASFKRYAHTDHEHAARLFEENQYRRCLIMTDSVFSMDGNVAPLAELSRLAENKSALLIVDDAHGFGVCGREGRGCLDAAGITPTGNVLMMGTLGKALGSYGAFVAGDAVFIEHLIQTARSYIYTTALPASLAVASLEALRLLQNEGGRLQASLLNNIAHFKSEAHKRGLTVLPSDTAIQPWILGEDRAAMQAADALSKAGFTVIAIRPPTVPKGTARLRISLSAAHSCEEIDALVNAMGQISRG